MFVPKTERIKLLAQQRPEVIRELESLFCAKTVVYIDYANVLPWSQKLGWHIDLKRLKQFLISFSDVQIIRIYRGTLIGNTFSEKFIENAKKLDYDVHTKPVKIYRLSIDVSSIRSNDPAILSNFIKKPLLQKLDLHTIEYLNNQLRELNKKGIKYIEMRKCNFDVEIGRQILDDFEKNGAGVFILWSGDSDFADPLQHLLENGKTAAVFATARKVSVEIGDLVPKGLFIYDIKQIRNFICRSKEIEEI